MALRLHRVAKIREYSYHLEILTGLQSEEVAQIFVRVNSGGRSLPVGAENRDTASDQSV
jgi:hypothetical protein